MSAFSDQLNTDLAIFFNPNEVGETHTIDGINVDCTAESNRTQPAAGGEGGTWVDTIVLYAPTAALAALPQGLPVVDYVLNYDGRKYLVLAVDDQLGVTRVEMMLGQG